MNFIWELKKTAKYTASKSMIPRYVQSQVNALFSVMKCCLISVTIVGKGNDDLSCYTEIRMDK